MRVTIVAGNPKPQSRTLAAAEMVATALSGQPADDVIDVVTFGEPLLGWGDDAIKAAVATVAASDLVIIASPTYKATYTGLLKLFLDKFAGATGMAGVVVVPVMLGASLQHAMAGELTLKPVLVELGAICPTQALYLLDTDFDQPAAIEPWLAQWKPVVARLL